MKDAKNFKCYKRLINRQLLQVSGLCGTLFFSYLPKCSTQIYRAQYGDAMLVPFWGAPTWQPEVNENIWSSLLLWERLLFPRELIYMHINTSPNALTVQTAKNHTNRPFFKRDSFVTVPSSGHVRRKSWKFKMLYFEHKGCYRAGNLWKDIFLVVPSQDDDKSLATLASFDFRILWRDVKTSHRLCSLSFLSISSKNVGEISLPTSSV